jgi:hypothetical protein
MMGGVSICQNVERPSNDIFPMSTASSAILLFHHNISFNKKHVKR